MDKRPSIQQWAVGGLLLLMAMLNVTFHERAIAQKTDGQTPPDWVAEIEKIFIRSEDCKQCHDRHYEEWKGIREQTPDLKSFGRVDAALLHGTAFESPVFRTVLGLWMQTNPTLQERQRCLSCHAPAVTVFPQHVEKITAQVLSGKPQVEGIGCASCHLINAVESTPQPPPTYKVHPGDMLYGPYANPEENLVHPAAQVPLFRGANFCTSCHFDKVKDVTQKDLPGGNPSGHHLSRLPHGTVYRQLDFQAWSDDQSDRTALVPRGRYSRYLAEKPQSTSGMDAAHRSRSYEVRSRRRGYGACEDRQSAP